MLHYHSQRQGLWPWVEGILDEVANLIFGIQIQMEMLQGRHDGTSDHEVRHVVVKLNLSCRGVNGTGKPDADVLANAVGAVRMAACLTPCCKSC